MSSSISSLLFVLICSWAFVVNSEGLGGASLPCIQKLMPCQPYLKGSSSPPATCCAPLKEIVADDSKCLCAVFNNPALLKSLNVTQENALALAKTCGANADTSLCKKGAAAPSGSHGAHGSHSTPSANSTSSNSSSSTAAPAPKKSAATSIGRFPSLAAILISSIIVSAF